MPRRGPSIPGPRRGRQCGSGAATARAGACMPTCWLPPPPLYPTAPALPRTNSTDHCFVCLVRLPLSCTLRAALPFAAPLVSSFGCCSLCALLAACGLRITHNKPCGNRGVWVVQHRGSGGELRGSGQCSAGAVRAGRSKQDERAGDIAAAEREQEMRAVEQSVARHQAGAARGRPHSSSFSGGSPQGSSMFCGRAGGARGRVVSPPARRGHDQRTRQRCSRRACSSASSTPTLRRSTRGAPPSFQLSSGKPGGAPAGSCT